MPLYEYLCDPCEEKFEVLRTMSKGAEPASCPTCGGEGHRVLSVFASVSVGTGGEPISSPIGGMGGGGACCGGACGCS
jgi:putative FmdB family regulatory protein